MWAGSDPYLQRGAQVFHRVVYERALLPTLLCSLHRRTGQGGRGGSCPPKDYKVGQMFNISRAKSGKLKSQKAPSLLGKQRQSGNIRFTVGWAQSEKVGQISFRPPNFFLPVRPWQSATLLSQYYH